MPNCMGGTGRNGCRKMNKSTKYVKLVEWSEKDDCYIGSCAELFYGGWQGICECIAKDLDVLDSAMRKIILKNWNEFDSPGYLWIRGLNEMKLSAINI